ncbi:MAG: dihydrodiol dehydrogenase [Acidimicrobiales bacterium]
MGARPEPEDGGGREGSVSFVVANEFAEVIVARVLTRNGMRLQVHSPRLGSRVQLDALELESLTWQSPETFSRFLEEPFGPPASGRQPDSAEDADGRRGLA